MGASPLAADRQPGAAHTALLGLAFRPELQPLQFRVTDSRARYFPAALAEPSMSESGVIPDRPSPDSQNEADEAQRARAGDAEVWRLWFDRYYTSLYRYAYFRLQRADEAEDVAAEVFAEAVRGIDRYRGKGSVLAWLYGIEKNLIYDRERKVQRQLEQTGGLPEAGADDTLDALPLNIDLLKAIEALTEEQRESVVLRFFLGMPTREIARVMGKTETAVFSLQARALATLRRTLGDDFLS